ncbi:cilia- and flagella-associated protein 337-like isoform X1 [Mytilus galloprovincialis]|uniref:cilia- and flagella-associated protein 337-like isoform X1 n=1 Tax=Mytilus galloprovincialis TaxID=29158 RepID=UPI003F7C8B48
MSTSSSVRNESIGKSIEQSKNPKTPEKNESVVSDATETIIKPKRKPKPKKQKKEPDEWKTLSMDKLENRLTMKDLNKLQRGFMSIGGTHSQYDFEDFQSVTGGDGTQEGKLILDREQFCDALSILLDKGTKEEYGELFDKIDVAREGTVDWDKLASHMLLEFTERDDKVKSTQVPQWKDLKTFQSPHKDIIQRVSCIKNNNRYVAISKEGTISMWGQDLKAQRAIKTQTDSCKTRDLWVTDFVILQNINKIALSFTSKEIAIYDMSTKMEFSPQYKIQNLHHTPLSLDYWSNPNNVNEAMLVWGDVGGYVNALYFSSVTMALFDRPPAPAGEKQASALSEPCLNVNINDVSSDVANAKYKNVVYFFKDCHKGQWVRQVKYSQYLDAFISCSTTNNNSMAIAKMEKAGTAEKGPSGQQIDKNKPVSRSISRRPTYFDISQGVNAFDYSQNLNLIATAGVNHHICLWNPYVNSKPNGVLRGHMASVVQAQFMKSRSQLISFSKDKVLRIWDVQLQVCIQRLAGMFPKGPEVHSTLFFDEGKDRNGLDRNRLFLTFNYQLTLLEMKAEIRDRILSHDKPVIAAIYNEKKSQIISVCQQGTMIVWMIDTGQKVKQFNNIHGTSEVTCLAQDSFGSKIYTGGTDGLVKEWDFNGHCYHQLECAGGQPADIGQTLILKRSVVSVGWTKYITLFRNAAFREHHVQPSDWKGGQEHVEDILCIAYSGPNLLATGSYDGEIIVWNLGSEQVSKRLNVRCRRILLKGKSNVGAMSREATHMSTKSRPRSRASQRQEDSNDFGYAVTRLQFLEERKHQSAGGGANLVSCGGNGWVRFWNTAKSELMAEFVAHTHAGSIIMAIDAQNRYLATGDVDGSIKVWDIKEYCLHQQDEIVTAPPKLKSQFQPHVDMINTLEMCERNGRTLVISASSDCSVAVYDFLGKRIGVCGQEEHWKVEQFDPAEEIEEEEEEEEEEQEEKETEEEKPLLEKDWKPDERAISDLQGYRIHVWDTTILGKEYQETRTKKRERKQPGNIPDLPYLHWERTGQAPAGPYSALETKDLQDLENLKVSKQDFNYVPKRKDSHLRLPKLPNLVDTLQQPIPEKEIFPKYILDFEAKMKSYHKMQLEQQNQPINIRNKLAGSLASGLTKSSLQNIGQMIGQNTSVSTKSRSVKNMKMSRGVSRRTSVVSSVDASVM